MPSRIAAQEDFTELDQAYRLAFRKWTLQLHNLQAADDPQSRQAHDLFEAAESDYRQQHDRLAGYFLTGTRFSRMFAPPGAKPLTDEQRRAIERAAYRLWEEAGRPAGTAESDWLRAERIVLGKATTAAGQ
jgi:hypothetical protein